MSHRARLTGTAIVATAAFVALLSSPPDAAADGLPVVGINARPLSAPGSDVAYVTRRSGRRTVLELIDADMASIDTTTFQARPRVAARDEDSGLPWALLALPTLLLLGAAAALAARLGRQRELGRGALGRARDAAGRALERTR